MRGCLAEISPPALVCAWVSHRLPPYFWKLHSYPTSSTWLTRMTSKTTAGQCQTLTWQNELGIPVELLLCSVWNMDGCFSHFIVWVCHNQHSTHLLKYSKEEREREKSWCKYKMKEIHHKMQAAYKAKKNNVKCVMHKTEAWHWIKNTKGLYNWFPMILACSKSD